MAKIDVLDHGFVELLENGCSDLAVVNAARVSYGKQVDKITPRCERLIQHLASNNHWTPFGHQVYSLQDNVLISVDLLTDDCVNAGFWAKDLENTYDEYMLLKQADASFYAWVQAIKKGYIVDFHDRQEILASLWHYQPLSCRAFGLDKPANDFLAVEVVLKPSTNVKKFRIKMPFALIAQWDQHKIATVKNQRSLRFTHLSEVDCYVPYVWRGKPAKGENKQGSGEDFTGLKNASVTEKYKWLVDQLIDFYKLHQDEIANEQLRFILPTSAYSEFVQTMANHTADRIIELRDKPDAQLEIQQYAKAIKELI